jgi:hypothetical protein
LPAFLTLVLPCLFFNREFGKKAGVLWVLLLVSSEPFLYFSLDIKMYMQCVFFVTICAVCAWYILKNNGLIWRILFIICAVCAAYSHYWAAIFAGLVYLVLFVFTIRYHRAWLKHIVAIGILGIVCYLPWVPVALSRFTVSMDASWIKAVTLVDFINYFHTLLCSATPIGTVCVLFLFFCMIVFFIEKNSKMPGDWFVVSLPCCIVILIVVTYLLQFFAKPILYPRYLIPALGLTLFFFAIEGGKLKNTHFACMLYMIFLGFSILNIAQFFFYKTRENIEVSRMKSYIEKNVKQNDVFIFAPSLEEDGSSELMAIISYFYPNHTETITDMKLPAIIRTYKDRDVTSFFKQSYFHYTPVRYSDLTKYADRRKWLFSMEKNGTAQIDSFMGRSLKNAFVGEYFWCFSAGYQYSYYHFALYRLD